MITFPNAKINLGLFITDKRSDGYHSIESVFYPVYFCDVLEAVFFPDQKNVLELSGLSVEGNTNDNIVVKSIRLIQEYISSNKAEEKIALLNKIRFLLHKNIPAGAGLGGGSANGSFALKMMNEMLELKISNEELEKMALKLGSDCPFFIRNSSALVKGRGEIISDFSVNLKGKQLVLIHPGIHVSTAGAYSKISCKAANINWEKWVSSPLSQWKNDLRNDFEESVFADFPEIKATKEILYKNGAVYAQMSGSGSAVYGIFENVPEKIKNLFPENYKYFTCEL